MIYSLFENLLLFCLTPISFSIMFKLNLLVLTAFSQPSHHVSKSGCKVKCDVCFPKMKHLGAYPANIAYNPFLVPKNAITLSTVEVRSSNKFKYATRGTWHKHAFGFLVKNLILFTFIFTNHVSPITMNLASTIFKSMPKIVSCFFSVLPLSQNRTKTN